MVKVTNNAKGPRGLYRADGELVMIEPGQSFDGELAKGHKLYEGLTSGKATAAAADDDADDAEPGPLDGSIAALSEHIAGVDDADEIQALIDGETAGKSRAGALTALNERLEALKGEDDDG